jgi:CRISPR-associated endoribonuclease Cas6
LILPGYKGSTLRGGFGSTFRRVVCVVRDKECIGCLLKGKCVYSYVFETPPPTDTKIMKKYEAAPHPFIIEPPLEPKRGYKPGDELVFGLTLIGRAIDYLPYFIYTFDELGKTGLGKDRGSFLLKQVSVQGGEKVIYTSETKILSDFKGAIQRFDPFFFEYETSSPSRLALHFLTPTRITYNGRLTQDIEFHIIIRNLLRRISLISYFHSNDNGREDIDFKSIIEKAKAVKIAGKRLRIYDWERYSGRQERRINMAGVVGRITFEGDIAPFMPLLKAGEVLHVGKGTVFGLGRYEVDQS